MLIAQFLFFIFISTPLFFFPSLNLLLGYSLPDWLVNRFWDCCSKWHGKLFLVLTEAPAVLVCVKPLPALCDPGTNNAVDQEMQTF